MLPVLTFQRSYCIRCPQPLGLAKFYRQPPVVFMVRRLAAETPSRLFFMIEAGEQW